MRGLLSRVKCKAVAGPFSNLTLTSRDPSGSGAALLERARPSSPSQLSWPVHGVLLEKTDSSAVDIACSLCVLLQKKRLNINRDETPPNV